MKKITLALLVILLSNTLAIADIGSLTATSGLHNKIVLNWVNEDLDIVMLIRKIGKFPTTTTDGITVYMGTKTTYTDLGLINGITYYYTAFDSRGSFSYASATPTTDISPPSSPGTVTEGLPDVDINDTGVYTVYWEPANDEESNIIEYELEEKIDNGSWTLVAKIAGTSIQLFNRVSGKVYYYRVRAKNEANLQGSWSTTSDGIRVVNKAVELPATQTIEYKGIKIDIPANAFIGSVTFTISEIPTPVNIASSTPQMRAKLSQCYELLAFGTTQVQPIGSLTIIFKYSPISAGTETNYRIYRLVDEIWQLVPGSQTIIPEQDIVMVEINSLSTYVVGYPKATLTSVSSFTAIAGNNRQVDLNWEFPKDSLVTEVIILRDTGTYATTPYEGIQIYRGSGTTCRETLLTPNTTYYYTAFTSDGGINYSEGVFVQAIATDTTPPGLVGSFTVAGKFKKIVINWTNPDDADFESTQIVRRLYGFPQTPKDGILIYKGRESSFTDENVYNDQIYYYTAFTFDGINYSIATVSVQGSATPTKDISPPSIIGTITEGYFNYDIDVSETGSYWVCWSEGTDTESGIANYELQERKNLGNWKTISDNIPVNYYLITGRELGNTYYYRIRAKNGARNCGSWSTTSDGIRVVHKAVILPTIGTIKYGQIELDVPNNTFVGSITFTIAELPPSSITNFSQATTKIKKLSSSAWELLAINPDNKEEIPTTPLTLFITYSDTGLSEDEEKKLKIYHLNKNTDRWEMLSNAQIIFTDENKISCTITTLSTFLVALPSYPASTLNNLKVYPNPFKQTKGHDKIIFEGLKDNVKIRIYKLTGELVYEEEYSSTKGCEEWDVTNEYGKPLASGVYIYVVEGSGEKAIGKIAIIR